MSATDEELKYVKDVEIDHVTYILIMFSISFVLYCWMTFLIHLYSTSGRNAQSAQTTESIELSSTRRKWYARVPITEPQTPRHVIGEDDEE